MSKSTRHRTSEQSVLTTVYSIYVSRADRIETKEPL